jgi:hypothetical protein
MPEPSKRPSMDTDLESRYNNQRIGSAFDIKRMLSRKSGQIVDAESLNGATFQNPNGFEVGGSVDGTQFKDAQGLFSKELSIYMKGFSNKRYSRR